MSQELKLLSIIIPCYNGEKFIKEAIDSAIAQTYSNKEIIVVNDGSTDRSCEIVREYGDQVQLIDQKNSGVSAARNRGIWDAEGEYIMLLDADDALHPEVASRKIKMVEQGENIGLVLGHFSFIDQEGNCLDMGTRKREIPSDDCFYYMVKKSFGPLACLFKREVVKHVGWFDPFLKGSEDHDFFIRVAGKFRIAYDTEVGGYYRENFNSVTRNSAFMIRECKRMYKKNSTIREDRKQYWMSKTIGKMHVYNFYYRRVMLEPGSHEPSSYFSRVANWWGVCAKHPELFFLSPMLATRVMMERAGLAKKAYPFNMDRE